MNENSSYSGCRNMVCQATNCILKAIHSTHIAPYNVRARSIIFNSIIAQIAMRTYAKFDTHCSQSCTKVDVLESQLNFIARTPNKSPKARQGLFGVS